MESDHRTESYITNSGTVGKRLQGHNALLCEPALRRACTMDQGNGESHHIPEEESYATHSGKRANKLRAVEIAVGAELVSEVQLTKAM